MKIIAPILTCLILAICVSAIAILSVQNATQLSLKFLNQSSMKLPVGVILTFSFAAGVIIAAILQPISNSLYSQYQKKIQKHQ